MSVSHCRGVQFSLLAVAWLGLGWLGIESSKATAQVNHASKPAQSILIGGEPVVTLRRPEVSDRSKPQFLDACILPGRGMAVLQIKAYLPGKGEIELLNSPPLPVQPSLHSPSVRYLQILRHELHLVYLITS